VDENFDVFIRQDRILTSRGFTIGTSTGIFSVGWNRAAFSVPSFYI